MSSYPKYPAEIEQMKLARKNLPVLAERLRWPAGALQACIDLEDRHPGWLVSWVAENRRRGFERPAGFVALLDAFHKARLYAPTAAELEPLMEAIPEHDWSVRGCDYCIYEGEQRLRRAGF